MIQNSWIHLASDFFIKEVVIRGTLQEAFSKGFKQILPNQKVDVFSAQVELTTLVAIVATSVLFGAAQIIKGAFAPYIVFTTIGSISYGVLASHYHLTSLDIVSKMQTLKVFKKD